MKKEIDQELLIRYINDRCSTEDLLKVQQFLQDPDWKQALENMLEAEFSAINDEQPNEKALEEWNQEFREKYFKKPVVKSWYTQWIGYAAACLLVLGIAGYFLNQYKQNKKVATSVAMVEKSNPRGVRSRITLPDSSVVYLGAGSSIRFPAQFEVKERTLILTGEAFFEISKNPQRPFIIHTGEILTTVLGTSFKITAFKGDPLSVEVATGKVRVSKKEPKKGLAELAVLIPGEGVIWDEKKEKATAIKTNISAVKDWAKGEISFKNRSLKQIALELENWYAADISFAKSVAINKRFSLSVDGTASLLDALDIICSTAQLKYHFSGKQVVITSNNTKHK
jgi:transmembrane sensor